MKKVVKYMRGFEKECVLGPLFKLLEALLELLVPLVVARIVDNGIGGGNQSYVIRMCLVMIGLGLVGLLFSVTAQYFAARAAVGFCTRLRHALLDHVLGLSYTQIDRLGTSTLITRMTSDINQVQSGVNLMLRLLLRSPFVVFGAMVMAFTIDTQAALVFAGVIPVLCVIVFGIMLITMPKYKQVQAGLDQVTSATRQNLTGVRVLRAFCKEDDEVVSFQGKTQELTRRQLLAGRISSLMNPVTYVVINLAIVLLIRVGAMKVYTGALTQGLVIALYNYMSQILVELIKMADLIINMTKAAACADRIGAVLSVENDQTSGNDGTGISGGVEFRDVSTRYSGAGDDSLSHISFQAAPGQTVGIIGGTGSGKSTLVNLIARFYDATQGTVRIDGQDIRSLSQQDLREKIGVVPQRAALFKGTIRENMKWGREDATDAEIWDALTTAQAREIVEGKDGQLDFKLEQNGRNLSGGQRQRLTIARAVVKKPEFLILDDSASALDFATDAALRRSLHQLSGNVTTFLVSQRAASIRQADLILVLDDGELVGRGVHEDLIHSCETYREIYFSQFPEERAKYDSSKTAVSGNAEEVTFS